MRSVIFAWLSIVLLPGLASRVSGQSPEIPRCAVVAPSRGARITQDTGGLYLPAEGVVRALVVFASFPDDETSHPYWPAHAPPPVINDFIDPDTTARSTGPVNLTNYFRQMSLGKLQFIGQAIWVESRHSQTEYQNGAYGRANTDILKEQVDSLVDFSRYDAWSTNGPYVHNMTPDGQVDMIIMIWRTAMFEFLGEASLGYRAGFVLDGKRVEMGFPDQLTNPLGSGITCTYRYSDSPTKMMRTVIHELGHWLMGGAHPYNNATLTGKHTYWGILCDAFRSSSCANAYERERLGWLTVPSIVMDSTFTLGDFVVTGEALKYHPQNGEDDEYFYLENHQGLSPFDDVSANPGETGVWVLHQQGPYMEMDNLRVLPADGRWHWENPGTIASCFGQTLPVFTRGLPGILLGASHRDELSTASSDVNWMYVYKDSAGVVNCGEFFKGAGFSGAFSPEGVRLFSPTSNPASNTWAGQPTSLALEVLNVTQDRVALRAYGALLDAPPAGRYLGRLRDTLQPGKLHLAWGAEWPDGQPLESDFSTSEVERMIGEDGTWQSVFQDTTTSWTDSGLLYDSTGTIAVQYRVRVRDAQGKYSPWSNALIATVTTVTAAIDDRTPADAQPLVFALGLNCPNPFNPTTAITYTVPVGTRHAVSLHVFDVLGRQVSRLVNGLQEPGVHHVMFDATGLPSGVYICRMTAGGFAATRKLLLLK